MKTSTVMTSLPLPAPFLSAFRDAVERLDDGPLAPAIDLFTTRDSIVANVALPGVQRKNVDIAVADDIVTIRGFSEPTAHFGAVDYIHDELFRGPFSRSFRLPTPVTAEGAIASLKDGLLMLTLPKATESTGAVVTVPVS